MNDLCVVCINFQTPDLLEVPVESFRKFYSTIPILLVDNGSQDNSTDKIRQLEKKYSGCTQSLLIDAVNRRGFHSDEGTPIVLSPDMMLRRKLYHDFPPFEHRGMPTLRNFVAAQRYGCVLKSFPVEKYVAHFGRGTVSRYGYGLGMRGKVDYVLNKLGL